MRIVPLALSVCLCVLPASLSAQPAEPPADPALSFEERAVVVSGLRPNGQVAWFGVAREVADDWATLVRREEVAADTDGDGVVRLELGREVPLQSVWVAVDLTSGKVAIAAPEGFALRVTPLPVRGLGRGLGEGSPDYLEVDRASAEVFVARPGVGAWGTSAGDGGEGDDGPLDRIELEAFGDKATRQPGRRATGWRGSRPGRSRTPRERSSASGPTPPRCPRRRPPRRGRCSPS